MVCYSYLLYVDILLFLYMNLQAFECTLTLGNETDRLSLLAIKDQITGDPLGPLSSWNDTLHFCMWRGITCGPRYQRVMILDLSSMNLQGSMSPYIGNLSFLRRISFQENNFYSEFPQEIGHLLRLQYLNLSFNSFQGEIPKNLSSCLDLRVIGLISNKFVGNIPIGLGSLSKLNILWLDKNNLTGTIPPSLGNISSLNSLSLAKNSLDGRIPNDLGRLSSLKSFQVSLNKLSGVVPASLYNISSINTLIVAMNQLHGSLPSDMGITLPNLQRLWLGGNQFTGPIPFTLPNASKLESFDIAYNAFVGPVPASMGGLQNLKVLNLGANQLGTGAANDLNFLTSLSNSSGLERLILNCNNFSGSLPTSISNLSTHLLRLRMGENQLTGSIPSAIENLVSLTTLDMEYNFLTGTIPFGIGYLSKLQVMYLSRNRLRGEIPCSIGNLTLLNELYLYENGLWGSIPASLGKCRYLNLLDFSKNELNDTIPKQIGSLSSLSSLNLAQNFLTGSLPSEVGKLIKLIRFDISGNRFSGEIPSMLSNCVMLEFINMKNNSFQGVIPSSLSTLRSISELDLSSNEFSGRVPNYLGEFPLLQYLNLSFNDLEGEIPKAGIFKNTSAFSVIGNKKLCGGVPELQLPNCIMNVASKKWGSSLILKVIVAPVIGVLSLTLLLWFLVVCYWKRKSKKKPSSISSIQDPYIKISYAELCKATDGFSSDNLIGVGSHGLVYKGVLDIDEKSVAVKVFNHEKRGASKSFVVECRTLRNVRHRNLIKVLTACSSVDFKGNDFQALVLEYMPNGNLDKWLHPKEYGQNQLQTLSLTKRLNIALEVAFALEYLHHHCQTPIAHCDLKPSNILLDDNMSAHVSDFGLARLLYETGDFHQNQSSSVAIKGSIGYVPPEYGLGGEISTQGDVYSYGILLLEMFTGIRPTNNMFKDGHSLREFAKISIPNQVMDIVDSQLFLEEEGNEDLNIVENRHEMRGRVQKCLVWIVSIGVECSVESPRERMEMTDVSKYLQAIRDIYIRFYS